MLEPDLEDLPTRVVPNLFMLIQGDYAERVGCVILKKWGRRGRGSQGEPKVNLTQELVDEYARLEAQIDSLESRRDGIREAAVAWLREHESPAAGPYVLELRDQERCRYSWKDICSHVLESLGPATRVKAQAIVDGMNSVKKPVESLHVVRNAAYILSKFEDAA